MNAKDVFYHGIRDQIRRVLSTMGNEKVEMGLTAFETGGSNWGSCFFARAYPELRLHNGDAEGKLMRALALTTALPIRTVYCTFDSFSTWITKAELKKFIEDVLKPGNAVALTTLKTIEFAGSESKELTSEVFCAVD